MRATHPSHLMYIYFITLITFAKNSLTWHFLDGTSLPLAHDIHIQRVQSFKRLWQTDRQTDETHITSKLLSKRDQKVEKTTEWEALRCLMLNKYYSGDQIKNKMGWVCCTYGRQKRCIEDLGRKTRRKRPLGKCKRRLGIILKRIF